jgi:hypothetical protein
MVVKGELFWGSEPDEKREKERVMGDGGDQSILHVCVIIV